MAEKNNSKATYENPFATKTDVIDRWEGYDLKKNLLRGIYGMGFDTPSYIQKTSIKPIINKRDVRAQAQSGTGKTGAFAIAALQLVDESVRKTQILILVSTREIAEQNADRIMSLGKYMEDVHVHTLVGGSSIERDINILKTSPHIIVGTPGRVKHMISDRHLNTTNINLMIIDEADEMLKKGFEEEMKFIYSEMPSKNFQTVMFSATWEHEELEISEKILSDPVLIDLRQDAMTVKGIEQYYFNLGERPSKRDGEDKLKFCGLQQIFESFNTGQCIIFVNTKRRANVLHKYFLDSGMPAEVVHGDLKPVERSAVVDKLKTGECRILISTNLFGRGIDIQQLSLVFNIDLPKFEDAKEFYIHRIGRAGRFGRKGKAITFVFSDEINIIKKLEEHYGTEILEMPEDIDLS